MDVPSLSRRQFLGGLVAGTTVAACSKSSPPPTSSSTTSSSTSTTALGPTTGRTAGSLPSPTLAAGTDTLPEVEHIVVVMMENHSFDNVLGMLGRGDGFTLAGGVPTASNPDGQGNLVHAFHMPSPCQQKGHPSNTWLSGHQSVDGGKMDGFVTGQNGPVSMGYYTSADLPFTYGLAQTFPIADRYFSSVMAQTYPNRRFLVAATSLGLTVDLFPSPLPPNGTIFDALNKYGIPWKNYYSSLPTAGVFLPIIGRSDISSNLAPIAKFYSDAAAGTLPGFCIVDPDFEKQSEEDPQDVQFGDQFLGQVVNALLTSPAWSKTLLVWTYDEGGGYFDHVIPPAAVPPDLVPPQLFPSDPPGNFDQYGFRVPTGLVSPYAKKDYVSHVTYDHTSILKLVETKWNLPAMTARDANAGNLLDMVDFHRPPAFLQPPLLPAAANPAPLAGCLVTGPGTIPPPGAVTRP